MDLAGAIARWREVRDPRLAALIGEHGARAPGDPAVAATVELTGPKQAAALIAALPALGPGEVSGFVAAVDAFARTKRGSWPVVELLADRPPDPRFAVFARALLADFAALPHTSAKLWRRLVDIVEHHGDRGDAGALAGLVPPATAPTGARTRLTNVAQRLRARAGALPADELVAWRAALAALAPERVVAPVVVAAATDGEALLAAIRADPDDLGARAVYGDWLVARGDPRGEFIALQLQRTAGTLTDAGARREAALLNRHHRAWLEPLTALAVDGWHPPTDPTPTPGELAVPAPRFRYTTFANGFVARLQQLAVPKHRLAVLDDPIFATVTHARGLPRFTAAMRALRGARAVPRSAARTLAALRGPLAAIAIDDASGADARTLHGIADVQLRAGDWPALVRDNAGLVSLQVGSAEDRWLQQAADGGAIFATAPALRRLELAFSLFGTLALARTTGGPHWESATLRASLATPPHVAAWQRALAPLATLGPGGGPLIHAAATTEAASVATLRALLAACAREVVVTPK